MTLNTRLATVTALLIAVVGLPLPVRADPITLTGGTVEVSVGISSARMTFIGEGLFLRVTTEQLSTAIAQGPFSGGHVD
jgi:hypothetical protein